MGFIESLLNDIKCDSYDCLYDVWLVKNGKNIFELRLVLGEGGMYALEHINIVIMNPYYGKIAEYNVSEYDKENIDKRKCIIDEIQFILDLYK